MSLHIIVQDHNNNIFAKASVELRAAGQRGWTPIRYDDRTHRFVHEGAARGTHEVRVTGPKGWTEERLTVELDASQRRIVCVVAPVGMPFYRAADGVRVYFEAVPDRALLFVRGPLPDHADSLAESRVLTTAAWPKFEETRSGDERRLSMTVPRTGEKRAAALARLEMIASADLPKQGLSAQLAVPMKRGTVVEGLTDELIVRFESHVTKAEVRRIAASFNLGVVRGIDYVGNAFVLRRKGGPDFDLLKTAEDLVKRYPVIYAEPNVVVMLELDAYTPNDYLYPEQPHLTLINADDAWDRLDDIDVSIRAGSPDITIAVFDPTGVSPSHPDLTGALTDGTPKQVANFNFATMKPQTVAELSGDHGTQCAGSATGRFDNGVGSAGLAGNCHLIGARLPVGATGLAMADAWIWSAGFATGSTDPLFPAPPTTGADVISNSWGATGAMLSSLIRDALDFLAIYGRGGRGCVVCFSIGNLGYVQFSAIRTWAAYERTIAVGASINSNPTTPVMSSQPDPAGNTNNLVATVDRRAFYSPYGPEIDIVAPSHTSFRQGVAPIVDPVLSAVRAGLGDRIGNAALTANLTTAVSAGATSLPLGGTAGFGVGDFVTIGDPGAPDREFRQVTAVTGGQLEVAALQLPHAAGVAVATGPNDYAQNGTVGFGGTSHSCPTVAGAAALVLSARPDLNWVQVRERLRTSAVQIDQGQVNAIGQWTDLDGDGAIDFSQWYGYGRLNVDAAIEGAVGLTDLPDVVVRENLADVGTVPSGGWHAHSPDIWVRRTNDPIPTLGYGDAPPHENPIRGQDNYVFLRVRNVGAAVSNERYLRAMITHFPGFEFRYPQEWQPTNRPGETVPDPLVPGTYLIGETAIDGLAAGDSTIVKMPWPAAMIPPETALVGGMSVQWHPCVLAEVSPHDGPLPTGTSTAVKDNNNLAHRNIHIDDPTDSGVGDSAVLVGVVAGSTDRSGVRSIVLDRTHVPENYQVFLRLDSERGMAELIERVTRGGFERLESLPGTHAEPRYADECSETSRGGAGCSITFKRPTRFSIDCGDCASLQVIAPSRTRIEVGCSGGAQPARPALEVAEHEGKPVLMFGAGTSAVEISYHMASGAFEALALGLVRTEGPRRPALLKATQRLGDGTLSAGYSVRMK